MSRRIIYLSVLTVLIILVLPGSILFGDADAEDEYENTRASTVIVEMMTNKGYIELELYPDKAPITVDNFLRYARDGFYDGLIFHRVIEGFMIQGGGFYPDLTQKDPTYGPIKNEANNGLKNVRGTIAMARTNDPDSATCQFFINSVDNSADSGKSNHLDPGGVDSSGYAVFGTVTVGMNVVDEISIVETHTENGMQNVPVENVMIDFIAPLEEPMEDDDEPEPGDDDDDDDEPTISKIPNPVRNIQATAGDGFVEITWTAPVDNGAPTIRTYEILRSKTPSNFMQVGSVGANTYSYRDETVENGEVYYYKVRAVNDFEESNVENTGYDEATPSIRSKESPGFGVVLSLTAIVLLAFAARRRK